MRKLPVVICCMLLVHASARGQPPEAGEIDRQWLEKLQTDGKAALERYQRLVPRLEESSEVDIRELPGGIGKGGGLRPQFSQERVVRRGDDVIVEKMRVYDHAKDKPEFKLECDNSDYHFSLWKKTADSPYAVAEWKPGKRKQPLADSLGGLHGVMRNYLKTAIEAVSNEPKYVLQSIKFDELKKLLRVESEFDNGTKSKITIWLDPSHDWRVLERIAETSSATFTNSYTYGSVLEGVSFPSASKTTAVYRVANQADMEISTKVTTIRTTDKADADFRMTAFGLPEPMGMPEVKRAGTRWYIWLSLAALAIVVLFFAIRKLSKRHVQAETVKQ